MSRPPDDILDFRGSFRAFSNFSSYPVRIYDWTFPHGESAFHAQKYLDTDYWVKLQGASPKEAKALGRAVPLDIREWERERVDAMKLVVAAKTVQNDMVRTLLHDTGDAVLVEKNTWHDQFWGDCECPRHAHIVGQNQLGRIWMLQRDYWRGAT